MSTPSLPSGYDVAKHVHAGRSDCHLTVGFDHQRGHIPRFLIQLLYQATTDPVQWEAIARIDHNETSATGHDVYREGLHVDVARRSRTPVHLRLSHGPLPSNHGTVIRRCVEYLQREADYFIDVYEERRSPGSPPGWSPDCGARTPTFIRADMLERDMSRESSAENPLSLEELTELLANATDTTPEAIKRRADDLEIAPPEKATVDE